MFKNDFYDTIILNKKKHNVTYIKLRQLAKSIHNFLSGMEKACIYAPFKEALKKAETQDEKRHIM